MSRAHDLQREVKRLKSAISAIHDRLHADDVNAAHEACECALAGETVTQPNLTASAAARAMDFAAEFNALADRSGLRACCLLLLPSATVPGATSIQILGEVSTCMIVESLLRGKPSTYTGSHEAVRRG